MQVYIHAIQGHLPVEVIRTFRAFLEFCYIARRSVLTEDDLEKLQDALARFHRHRSVFVTDGVCEKGISLPRQHALVHYHALIRLFGVPNGLCTSLSESKHKESTKDVYRRSNRNNPLGQMLVANTRIHQLCAMKCRVLGGEDSHSVSDKSTSTNLSRTYLTF